MTKFKKSVRKHINTTTSRSMKRLRAIVIKKPIDCVAIRYNSPSSLTVLGKNPTNESMGFYVNNKGHVNVSAEWAYKTFGLNRKYGLRSCGSYIQNELEDSHDRFKLLVKQFVNLEGVNTQLAFKNNKPCWVRNDKTIMDRLEKSKTVWYDVKM